MHKKSQSTSIKGHNSAENLQKITGSNHNLDLVNINIYTGSLKGESFETLTLSLGSWVMCSAHRPTKTNI